MFYSIGFDIAKDSFHVCLLCYNSQQQTEKVVSTRNFNNTLGEFKKFAGWVINKIQKDPAPVRCTMEATGVYYEHLAIYIQNNHADWALSVVLGSQANKFNESEGLRSKTDKIDAHGLALMGARKRLKQWKGINPFWGKLRQLTRAREAVTDQITILKNQLHALQHSAYGIKETQTILTSCLSSLQKQQQNLDTLIKKHLQSEPKWIYPMQCVQSLYGVGLLTMAVVLAETLGFEQFNSKSQLMSYSGYDVRLKESGKYAGQTKISKMGNARIRKAMYMPANSIIRGASHPYCSYYERLLAKHGIKMKAHVALQKKLLSAIYYLWKKREMFDPGKAMASSIEHIAPHNGGATVDTATFSN
ncbi:MAG: IS110 family transposase [Candidatus Saccharimonadales bacterium]